VRLPAALVILGMFATLSCFPIIENVTDSNPVDPALESVTPDGGQVLVLPMWLENESCNLRSPFLISASEIMKVNDHLEPRHRLGIMDSAGHGPSHFRSIAGLLLFMPGARVLWVAAKRYPTENSDEFYWRPLYQGEYGSQLVDELKGWLRSERDMPPALLALGRLKWCGQHGGKVKVSSSQLREAVAYFDSDPRATLPIAFSGWRTFSASWFVQADVFFMSWDTETRAAQRPGDVRAHPDVTVRTVDPTCLTDLMTALGLEALAKSRRDQGQGDARLVVDLRDDQGKLVTYYADRFELMSEDTLLRRPIDQKFRDQVGGLLFLGDKSWCWFLSRQGI